MRLKPMSLTPLSQTSDLGAHEAILNPMSSPVESEERIVFDWRGHLNTVQIWIWTLLASKTDSMVDHASM